MLEPCAGTGAEPAARRLIRRFGSLRAIWSASVEALERALTSGGGKAGTKVGRAIVAARGLAEAAVREALTGTPIDIGSSEFRQYLVHRLGIRREECVMILFFTADGLFIAEDFYSGGTRGASTIPLRRTVRRALDLDARRLVIAHNHPSGQALPSEADIAATTRQRALVESLEIRLDDHCIVAGNAVTSLRVLGMV